MMGLAVEGMVLKYTAETEAQARQAFDLAAGIAARARARFKLVEPIMEVQHPSGGAVVFRWVALDEGGEVLE